MNTDLEELDLERDFVQWAVRELVRAGLETPLREPILEAVSEASDAGGTAEEVTASSDGSAIEAERTEFATERETDDSEGKSRIVKAVQGLTVFVLLFVVLYATFKRVSGDERA